MINTLNRRTLGSSRSSIPLADQAQILAWRVAFVATRLAGRLWRDLAPVIYPVRYFLWLPLLAVPLGFVAGLAMALTMR